MGSAASTKAKKGKEPKYKINDNLARDHGINNPVVQEKVKAGLKSPFIIDSKVTLGNIKSAQNMWSDILNENCHKYIKFKHQQPKEYNETCSMWFVRKFYHRVCEIDSISVDIYPSEVERQVVVVSAMMGATFKVLLNMVPENATDEHILEVYEDKLYDIAKSHFIRGVETKQYSLMCMALLDCFKYCFESDFTDEIKTIWIKIFSSMLVPLMRYSYALELLYASDRGVSSGNNSFNTNSFQDPESTRNNNVGGSVVDGSVGYSTTTFSEDESAVSTNSISPKAGGFMVNGTLNMPDYREFNGLADDNMVNDVYDDNL
eukprot:TRINITY_DN36207_c0_g1_i1.p1 TRINITY_DN36207_c0_g1~~TRINITY_DN36207_c0_g1_i1.p1  ORF type:complete len:318 (+),score=-11.86 TRINITY_DN36207_c0_g1_i1:69-1022(+)